MSLGPLQHVQEIAERIIKGEKVQCYVFLVKCVCVLVLLTGARQKLLTQQRDLNVAL